MSRFFGTEKPKEPAPNLNDCISVDTLEKTYENYATASRAFVAASTESHQLKKRKNVGMLAEVDCDYDDLIEYCPNSPGANILFDGNASPEAHSGREVWNQVNEDGWPVVCLKEHYGQPQIILVCSLCLRQYDLEEDLRGHMIEYHKCKPLVPAVKTSIDVEEKEQDSLMVEIPEPVPCVKELDIPEEVEIKPVPFKEFRTILRAKMLQRCKVSYACAYKFEDDEKMQMHARCHMEISTQQFKCFECGSEFQNWRKCSTHLWKAHQVDIDLLKCPVCAFKASASVLVWRHMRAHKRWRARILRSLKAVQLRRQQNLQKQIEIEKRPPPVNKNKYYSEKTCEICDRKFVNGKTLSKHVKTVHNKIKPFICNVCGKKTARKASLTIHMRQHTFEKPLQCKTCKFSTRDPSVLYKHQRRHDNTGRMKCPRCDFSCIQTNAYKHHLRLQHPEEYAKIACDLCTFVTISEERLAVHRNDHQRGLIVNKEDSMDALRLGSFKSPRKMHDKNNEVSVDCFMPLESVDSIPHEPVVDTGGVTIPAHSEDTQFPTYLNN